MAERKADELELMLSQRERNNAQLQQAVGALERRLEALAQAASAEPTGDDASSQGVLDVEGETRRLRAELRDIVDADTLDFRAAVAGASGAGGALGSSPTDGRSRVGGPPPLSRMRKAELVAECESVRPRGRQRVQRRRAPAAALVSARADLVRSIGASLWRTRPRNRFRRNGRRAARASARGAQALSGVAPFFQSCAMAAT